MKRFSFFDDSPGADDILKHADEIQIRLMKCKKGFGIVFKITGGYLPDCDDDEEDEGEEIGAACCTEAKPDAAELADSLLQRFIKAKGGAQ